MAIFWFLCGLSVGLCILFGYNRRLNRRLTEMVQLLSGKSAPRQGVSLGQLSRLLNQHRNAQQELHQQVTVLQEILQASPLGYLEVDGADQLCWHNSKARQLLKIELPLQMVSGRLLMQVVRSLELEALITEVRQSQQSSYQDWEMYRLPENGAPAPTQNLPLRGYGVPLPDLHVGVFIEDRQEATMLAQERDRWASDVAHELKTPLTSIRLMVETLQEQVEPSLRTWTERLLNEAARLSCLVQDLLELSYVSRRNAEVLCVSDVDLPALIRAAWLNLEPLAEQKNLALYYQGTDNLTLQADEARLYRVLLNVIDNGIKHSPPDQALMIEVSTQANLEPLEQGERPVRDWVVVDVIDAGDGFPPVAIAHIFKRFFRADPSRVRMQDSSSPAPVETQASSTLMSVGSGSGLGLAIVEQIVAAHGGRVEAQNHPQTGGAWLRILLPYTP